MSVAVKIDFEQPEVFEFSKENFKRAKDIVAKYPVGKQQSAVMPLLTLSQKQHEGWLPDAAIRYVAELLTMPYIRAYEVASFYTMYNLQPVGKYHVQCCTTTPCWLRGSDDVVKACKDELGIGLGETTEDGQFTLNEVECAGACVNAPVIQLATTEYDRYFEDLDYDTTVALIKKLKAGKDIKAGPVNNRFSSEPIGGLTSLESQEKLRKKQLS